MLTKLLLACIFAVLSHAVGAQECSDLSCMLDNTNISTADSFTKVLSRRRRYLVFPEGSSFSMAASIVIGWYGQPHNSFVCWATNWGLSYNLPNETYQQSVRRKLILDMPISVTQRRFRRDLYKQVEKTLDGIGQNGRDCVLRALCEVTRYFGSQGSTMVREIMRVVFTLPTSKVLSFEHPDLHMYYKAYKNGRSRASCSKLYPKCGFSLHTVALGGLFKPPKPFMM